MVRMFSLHEVHKMNVSVHVCFISKTTHWMVMKFVIVGLYEILHANFSLVCIRHI
jgi:hypothetical protein